MAFHRVVKALRRRVGVRGREVFLWKTGSFRTASSQGLHRKTDHGVYLFWSALTGKCLYIGKAGRVQAQGTITPQGFFKRLNNLRSGRAAARTYQRWRRKYGPLRVEVLAVWERKHEAPGEWEARLLGEFFRGARRLPAENKEL